MFPSPGEYSQEISSSPLLEGSAFTKLEPRPADSSSTVNSEQAFGVTPSAEAFRAPEVFVSVTLWNRFAEVSAFERHAYDPERLNFQIPAANTRRTSIEIRMRRSGRGCPRAELAFTGTN